MPLPTKELEALLKKAIDQDDVEKINELHSPDNLEAIKEAGLYIGRATSSSPNSTVWHRNESPVFYAAIEKKLKALKALLALGHQVTRENRSCVMEELLSFVFGLSYDPNKYSENFNKEIFFTLLSHSSFNIEYFINRYVSCVGREGHSQLPSLQDLIKQLDRTKTNSNIHLIDVVILLAIKTLLTVQKPFIECNLLGQQTALYVHMLYTIIFADDFNQPQTYSLNNPEIISHVVKLAWDSGLISPSRKNELLIYGAEHNLTLKILRPMISYQTQLNYINFQKPYPTVYERIIIDILMDQSYLHSDQNLKVLRACSSKLSSITPIKKFLKSYADFVALDHGDAWVYMIDYVPTGVPKRIKVNDTQGYSLFCWSKWLLAKNGKKTEFSRFIGLIVQLHDNEILFALIFKLITRLTTAELTLETRNLYKDTIKTITQVFPVFHWVLALMYQSGLVKHAGINKVDNMAEFFRRLGHAFATEVELWCPLVHYLLKKSNDTHIAGPKTGLDVHGIVEKYVDRIGFKFLCWFERYILLNLDEFGINGTVVQEIYPNHQAADFVAKMLVEQAILLPDFKIKELDYDPLVNLNHMPSLVAEQPFENSPPVTPLPVVSYPFLELTADQFANELKNAIDNEEIATITALHNQHFMMAFDGIDRQKSLIRYEKQSPLQYAAIKFKLNAVISLLEIGYRVSEENASAIQAWFARVETRVPQLIMIDKKVFFALISHPSFNIANENCDNAPFKKNWMKSLSPGFLDLDRNGFHVGMATFLLCFKISCAPSLKEFKFNTMQLFAIFAQVFFYDLPLVRFKSQYSNLATCKNLYQVEARNLILESGLLPEKFKQDLLEQNAEDNIHLGMFRPLIQYENRYYYADLLLANPEIAFEQIAIEIILTKAYMHDADARHTLQLCSNKLLSCQNIMPYLRDYADYVALDHSDAWKNIHRYVPLGLPKELSLSEHDEFKLYGFAKVFMAKCGHRNKNHLTTLLAEIKSLSAKQLVLSDPRSTFLMQLLFYAIFQIISDKTKPEIKAACKEVLRNALSMVRFNWVFYILYQNDDCLKKYEKSTWKESHKECPVTAYVLSKRRNQNIEKAVPYVLSNVGTLRTVEEIFFVWLENYLILNHATFGISENIIFTAHPHMKEPNAKEELIQSQAELNFNIGGGLYYDPLPNLKDEIFLPMPKATAPLMSVIQSQAVSAYVSPVDDDGPFVVENDSIVMATVIEVARNSILPEQQADDDFVVEPELFAGIEQELILEKNNDSLLVAQTVSDQNDGHALVVNDLQSHSTQKDENSLIAEQPPLAVENHLLNNKPSVSITAEIDFPSLITTKLPVDTPIAIALADQPSQSQIASKPTSIAVAATTFGSIFKPAAPSPIQAPLTPINEIEQIKLTKDKLKKLDVLLHQASRKLMGATQPLASNSTSYIKESLNQFQHILAWKEHYEEILQKETEASRQESPERFQGCML